MWDFDLGFRLPGQRFSSPQVRARQQNIEASMYADVTVVDACRAVGRGRVRHSSYHPRLWVLGFRWFELSALGRS